MYVVTIAMQEDRLCLVNSSVKRMSPTFRGLGIAHRESLRLLAFKAVHTTLSMCHGTIHVSLFQFTGTVHVSRHCPRVTTCPVDRVLSYPVYILLDCGVALCGCLWGARSVQQTVSFSSFPEILKVSLWGGETARGARHRLSAAKDKTRRTPPSASERSVDTVNNKPTTIFPANHQELFWLCPGDADENKMTTSHIVTAGRPNVFSTERLLATTSHVAQKDKNNEKDDTTVNPHRPTGISQSDKVVLQVCGMALAFFVSGGGGSGGDGGGGGMG
ncbi:hypothetical protein C0Q70_19635 [Pomacea canaliculata]|uniref:Uncharacterized protein n=1 Tax=Pomacea canaliculata TaxID=400727 RepID=A0A2T7NJW3_POMCA|nr:hypothetical protein C0Q70_19635 [Pomacea canaliculata]